ncbi:hypothetical protein R6Q57_019173 [Mikania cordata]
MASTSAPRSDAGASRMKSAAYTLCGDNQTLLADIRKAMGTMKEIGISPRETEQNPNGTSISFLRVSVFYFDSSL